MRIALTALAMLSLTATAAFAGDGAEGSKADKTKGKSKPAMAEKAEKCWPRYAVGGRVFEDRSFTGSTGILHIVIVETYPNNCPVTVLGGGEKK
jgi:hypothetical protein